MRADSEAWARHQPGGPVHLSDFSMADTDGKRLSATFDGPENRSQNGSNGGVPTGTTGYPLMFDHAGTQVRVRHRWIAHVDICNRQGGTGLATLTDARLKQHVYLDKPSSVDAVIASGHHDLHLGAWDAAKRSKRLQPPTSPGQYAGMNMTSTPQQMGCLRVQDFLALKTASCPAVMGESSTSTTTQPRKRPRDGEPSSSTFQRPLSATSLSHFSVTAVATTWVCTTAHLSTWQTRKRCSSHPRSRSSTSSAPCAPD